MIGRKCSIRNLRQRPKHDVSCAVTACPLCPGTAIVTRMSTKRRTDESTTRSVPLPN